MKKMFFIIFLTFPLFCWSQIGDTYLCKDEKEEFGGTIGEPVVGEFFFTWNDKSINGSFTGKDSNYSINKKIIFQNNNEFIATEFYDGGLSVSIFNDSSGKGYFLRTFTKTEYHFVKKSKCKITNYGD